MPLWGGHRNNDTSGKAVSKVPSPPQQHSKNPSIGVKVLHSPEKPAVDIVAVHGLKGDAFRTWTASNDVLWLRDLLPKEVPKARILTYGYDSDPGTVFQSASTNMIHHHASTLVSELHYFRRKPDERRRPIIFVCHSLGGIVVKRALIYSNSCNVKHNPELRSITVGTYGVVFLGTPHMGSDLARWGKMAEMLVKSVASSNWIDVNETLVNTLSKNSETLQNITENFLGLSSDFRLYFFWEELKTSIAGMTRDVIVEQSSAVPQALPNVGSSGIHATHSNMCKFEDTGTPGWNVLAGVLYEWTEAAPTVVETKWQQEMQRQHIDLQWQIHGALGLVDQSPSMGYVEAGVGGSNTPRNMVEGGKAPKMLTGSDGILHPDEICDYESEAGDVVMRREHANPHTELIAAPSLPPLFFRPPTLQENKYFEGRTVELNQIHKTLHDPRKRAILISSVTGGGKTHLAREYVFAHREDFPGGVFWIDCKSLRRASGARTFSTDILDFWYSSIAEELCLPPVVGHHDTDEYTMVHSEAIRKHVIFWFERNMDRWLLVLDGVDIDEESQIGDVSRYLPTSTNGSMIITTVNASLAGAARLGSPELLVLPRMEIQAAMNMLFHYSQIHNPADHDRSSAVELCRELDYIPLAIHSAGSYIKSKQVMISDYLRRYQKRPFVGKDLLEPFHVIFERIEQRYVEANNFLRVLSFFEQEIPLEMLWWGVKRLGRDEQEMLIPRENGRSDINNTIGHLLAYSLILRSPQDESPSPSSSIQSSSNNNSNNFIDTLRIHSVAQDVCIERMRKRRDDLQFWLSLASRIFCNSFETLDGRRKKEGFEFLVSDYKRYVVHGHHILTHAKKFKVDSERLEEVLDRVRELSNGEGTISSGPRRSMFRSGSMTDTSSGGFESPEIGRTMSWCLPPDQRVDSPVEHDGPLRQENTLSKEEEEVARKIKHDLSAMNKHKQFKFRYDPPKGPRNPHVIQRRNSTASHPIYTGQGIYDSPASLPKRAQSTLYTPHPTPPFPPRETVFSTTYQPHPYYTPPRPMVPIPAVAYTPFSPPPPLAMGQHPQHPIHHYSRSAPMSSPYLPMPPYPVTPSNDIPDPMNHSRPNPFTPGYIPDRDVRNSPHLKPVRLVYAPPGPWSPSRTPSEVWSEPILEEAPYSPPHSPNPLIFSVDAATGGSPAVRISPPPGGREGLGIKMPTGAGGVLVSKMRKRSDSPLRRSSVPIQEEGNVGIVGEDMVRSKSEPGKTKSDVGVVVGVLKGAEENDQTEMEENDSWQDAQEGQ